MLEKLSAKDFFLDQRKNLSKTFNELRSLTVVGVVLVIGIQSCKNFCQHVQIAPRGGIQSCESFLGICIRH